MSPQVECSMFCLAKKYYHLLQGQNHIKDKKLSHSYSMLFCVVVCFQKCILQGSQVLVLLCNDFNNYIGGIRRKHAMDKLIVPTIWGSNHANRNHTYPLNLCFFTIFFTNIHETFSIHHLIFFSILNFLLIGCVHSKMSHTQLLCSFQTGKDLKLEIEVTYNHCTKFMV
jgi:hypothetical protein